MAGKAAGRGGSRPASATGLSQRTLFRYKARGIDLSDPIQVLQERNRAVLAAAKHVRGTISLRQLAEVLRLPLTTVHRYVHRALEEGLLTSGLPVRQEELAKFRAFVWMLRG